MEESTVFRQQRESPFFLFLELCLCYIIQQYLFCCLPPGVQISVQSMSPLGPNNSPVYVSCGPKIRFNMTGRCLRPWSVKAGQTSRLHRPDVLRDVEGWQGLKSTEGWSFKWNGFQWWNVSPFSLREVSPQLLSLQQLHCLSHSHAVWKNGVQIHPGCSWESYYIIYVHGLKAQN